MKTRDALFTLTVCLGYPFGTVLAQASPGDEPTAEVTIGEQGSEQDPLSGRDRALAAEPEKDRSAESVEAMLGVPAIGVKIDPRVLGVAPGEPLPRLHREGETVRKRDGQLLPTGERGYAVILFDPDQDDERPLAMVVAPCLTLESMERLLEDRGDNLRFTVTGEVHTYRGINYLLPTTQPKPWLLADQNQGEITASPDDANLQPDDAEPVDADATAEVANDGAVAQPDAPVEIPTADEVLDDLLEQRRDAPRPIPAAPRADDEAATISGTQGSRSLTDPLLLGLDPDQAQAELISEGEFLIARTGRLVRSADGSHALFVLDADQAEAPEPPMIVQACKLLEQMEAIVREQGDDVPFVLTGQVFIYRGANYLLPTIVRREFDRGNLE